MPFPRLPLAALIPVLALPAMLSAAPLPASTDVFLSASGQGTFDANAADPSYPVRLIGETNSLADLYSPPGTGLSGAANDRAYDLNKTKACIQLDGRKAPMLLVNSSGFTLAGWYKSTNLQEDYSFVVSNANGIKGGVTLTQAPDGRAILEVSAPGDVMQNRAESSSPVFLKDGQWRFFAAVFNKGSVTFYSGTQAALAVNNGGAEIAVTSSGAEPSAWLQWGNQPANPRLERQFRALLDNLWVIDRALNAQEIEALRKHEVTAP